MKVIFLSFALLIFNIKATHCVTLRSIHRIKYTHLQTSKCFYWWKIPLKTCIFHLYCEPGRLSSGLSLGHHWLISMELLLLCCYCRYNKSFKHIRFSPKGFILRTHSIKSHFCLINRGIRMSDALSLTTGQLTRSSYI